MITLIDYGGSNLRSVYKALVHVGGEVQLSGDPEVVRQAGKLVLPGVGAFGAGMAALRQAGLDQAVREVASRGGLLLGICLGMQLLCDTSEEMGQHAGLGLISGAVLRFPLAGPKVPHMGWNQIEYDHTHALLAGIPVGAHAYFVHSYYCRPVDEKAVIATTEYGDRFAAVIGRDNVYGIQFHPEKSQQVGLRLLHNFVEMD